MPECSSSENILLEQDFSSFSEGSFAGINMKARLTAGPTGGPAARSEGTQAQIDNGWVGSAFGIAPGFTPSAVPAGIIEFDLLPATYVAPGGNIALIGGYYSLTYIAALGHRSGALGDYFRWDTVWADPFPASAPGVNPQTATWRHIAFAYQASSLTLDGSVWVPNSDGFMSVWVDDVEVYNVSGMFLSGKNEWPSNSHLPWNQLKIGPQGTITNIRIVECDAIAEPEPLPIPNPTGCPCNIPGPGSPDPTPPEPPIFLPPLDPGICAGLGLVPTGDVYTPPELWWNA